MTKKEPDIPSPFTVRAHDYYYDAMEILQEETPGAAIQALQVLEQGYKIDPELIDLQLGYIEAYNTLGIHASVRAHIELAYTMVQAAFPRWPQRLEWGIMSNRGYLRAIQCKADWLWEQGDNDEALTHYSRLLTLNPFDNQGVRYCIAAIHAGLSGQDLDALWAYANNTQDFDAVEDMFAEQNQKHQFWQNPLEDEEE